MIVPSSAGKVWAADDVAAKLRFSCVGFYKEGQVKLHLMMEQLLKLINVPGLGLPGTAGCTS